MISLEIQTRLIFLQWRLQLTIPFFLPLQFFSSSSMSSFPSSQAALILRLSHSKAIRKAELQGKATWCLSDHPYRSNSLHWYCHPRQNATLQRRIKATGRPWRIKLLCNISRTVPRELSHEGFDSPRKAFFRLLVVPA